MFCTVRIVHEFETPVSTRSAAAGRVSQLSGVTVA